MPGDPIKNVQSAVKIPGEQEPTFTPVPDLFAPFFDVTFFAPSVEEGAVAGTKSEPASFSGGSLSSFLLASTAKSLALANAADVATGLKAPIGSSTLAVRSVAGGLQSYGPVAEDSEVAQLVNYRSNLQVTMLSAAALQATLTLTPTYEAALKIVDHKLIRFGTLMEIQWGYLSSSGEKPAVSPKHIFRITQPSIKFGKQVTVTIGGFDILSGSLKSSDVRCHWLRETYPCDLDIIHKIVKTRMGSGAEVNDKAVGNDSPLRKRKAGTGVVQSDNDWTFFRRILRQNDVNFEQRDWTIVLRDEKRIDNLPSKYQLFWYGQPKDEWDIPMISFETNPILSLFAGEPGARGQRTLCRDSKTKKITKTDKDPGDTGKPQPGEQNTATTEKNFKKTKTKTTEAEGAAFAKLDASCASGRFFSQPCNRANQKEEIDRENTEIRRFFNTRASATCPGVPGFSPQQIATVRNVGDTFSGNYRVMKVVHNIGRGYTMKLDLLRSAASNVKGDGTTASRDQGNKKTGSGDSASGQLVTPTLVEDERFASKKGCVDDDATAQAQTEADVARNANEASASAAEASAEAEGSV